MVDGMTHQANGTAFAKVKRGTHSDPCSFGSSLLMSLGSASGLLRVALQCEMNKGTSL